MSIALAASGPDFAVLATDTRHTLPDGRHEEIEKLFEIPGGWMAVGGQARHAFAAVEALQRAGSVSSLREVADTIVEACEAAGLEEEASCGGSTFYLLVCSGQGRHPTACSLTARGAVRMIEPAGSAVGFSFVMAAHAPDSPLRQGFKQRFSETPSELLPWLRAIGRTWAEAADVTPTISPTVALGGFVRDGDSFVRFRMDDAPAHVASQENGDSLPPELGGPGRFELWTNTAGTADPDPSGDPDATITVGHNETAGATGSGATVESAALTDIPVAEGSGSAKTIYARWVSTDGRSTGKVAFVLVKMPRQISTAGAIASSALATSAQSFASDIAFSASDSDTVAWSAGTITIADGTNYSITASNTGTMGALTYIYLDTAVSSTALQTSTTFSNAVGDNRILMAVAKPAASASQSAFVVPAVGALTLNEAQISDDAISAIKVQTDAITTTKITNDAVTSPKVVAGAITTAKLDALAVTADKIAANAITATKISAGAVETDKLAANSVTAAKIDVVSLSAVSADMGTLTAGQIRLGSATGPTTGTGIFIGPDGADWEFRAGNPTGNHIHWDGTNLSITGTLFAEGGALSKTMVFHAAEAVPATSSTVWSVSGRVAIAPGSIGAGTQTFELPIVVPPGVTFTNIQARLYRETSSETATATLYRYSSEGSPTTMATLDASTNAAWHWVSSTLSHTTTSSEAYVVEIKLNANSQGAGFGAQAGRIQIQYEMTNYEQTY